MDNIYSSIINFHDDNEINYEKIKLLIDSNLKNGQNKFYISANNFNCSYLSSEQRKDYYKKMVNLMPDNTYFILELNFDSINDYQEIIDQLEKNNKKFKFLIQNYQCSDQDPTKNYEQYLKLFQLLDQKNLSNFYLSIDSKNLAVFDRDKLLKTIAKINDLEGVVISTSYSYDLDINDILSFKEDLNGDFALLGKADDFYYSNLENGLTTVSKYFNLFPQLFKRIEELFKENNFQKAKDYQLQLNDFIMLLNELGEKRAFDFLLNKSLKLTNSSKNKLNSNKEKLLLTKFDNLNQLI